MAKSDAPGPAGAPLVWSGRASLVWRILAVNILALLLMALGIVSLDSFRNQLQRERLARIADEAALLAVALAGQPPAAQAALLAAAGERERSRLRIYGADGARRIDSWQDGEPSYRLRDPSTQAWNKALARAADRGFNWLVGAAPGEDFVEPADDRRASWPEAVRAARSGIVIARVRDAPDLTPVYSAAAPIAGGATLLVTHNDREYTRIVRGQRRALLAAIAIASALSIIVSLFLAKTIVRPLRRIALAAHRVRLGRAREVRVPRLRRNDEIGLLARSVSDMSQALARRIDQMEAFAADVTHELKNPLASLRSAVDALERVDDPELRRQLLDVVRQDAVRLDRLVGDIGEAARTDAELARASFEPVDVGALVGQVVAAWQTRRETGNVRIAFARPRRESAVVLGEPSRLARAIDNLIDNAISFSPPHGLVEVAVTALGDTIRIRVEDEGPGVPDALKEAIFNRFHSVRPETENFGRHSGLGLAIARAIVSGHDGEIDVTDRDDAPSGAQFTITLPAAGAEEVA